MKSQEEVLSRFRNEFTTFETASHQYEKQEIDDKAYKAVSTGFGDYLQRAGRAADDGDDRRDSRRLPAV